MPIYHDLWFGERVLLLETSPDRIGEGFSKTNGLATDDHDFRVNESHKVCQPLANLQTDEVEEFDSPLIASACCVL